MYLEIKSIMNEFSVTKTPKPLNVVNLLVFCSLWGLRLIIVTVRHFILLIIIIFVIVLISEEYEICRLRPYKVSGNSTYWDFLFYCYF